MDTNSVSIAVVVGPGSRIIGVGRVIRNDVCSGQCPVCKQPENDYVSGEKHLEDSAQEVNYCSRWRIHAAIEIELTYHRDTDCGVVPAP